MHNVKDNRGGGRWQMRYFTLYMIVNKINNKKYIGITCQKPENRWKDGKGYKNKIFSKEIREYGWDNFNHILLFSHLNKEQAIKLEKEYIKKYKTNNELYGYNKTNGGEIRGLDFDKKTRMKMSLSAKKRDKSTFIKSEIIRKKYSKIAKEQKRHVQDKPPKKVIDKNGRIYESVKEASEALNINYYTLWNYLSGRRINKLEVRFYE